MLVVLLAVIWLLVSWGRLPSSSILVWYMCIHPMCFQFWVYWRGVQFRVAFSAFIRSVGESRSSSFLGWVSLSLFFQAFVLPPVVSVVDKALLTCGVECVTTWTQLLIPRCFLSVFFNNCRLRRCLRFCQSLSMVFHCLRCLLLALLSLF